MNNPRDVKWLRRVMRLAHRKKIGIRTYFDTRHAPRMKTEEPPKSRRHPNGRAARQDKVLRQMA